MDSDQARGALLGLACGDALGRPVEFTTPAEITATYGRLDEMVGHGTWNQPAGTITDDTEQALCLARSLAERQAFDPADIAERFVAWYDSNPFDIGRMTMKGLSRLKHGAAWHDAGLEVWKKSPEGSNAGNGSVMRCAPHGLAFAGDEEALVTVSRASSFITHADPRCQWACVVLNATIAGLLEGSADPLGDALALSEDAPPAIREACLSVSAVLDGETDPDDRDLANSGYVVTTLEAGLFHGLTAPTPKDAIVDAVMMGGDTDTIAAVTGAVAGARFGASQLPEEWVDVVDEAAELRTLAERLADEEFGIHEDVHRLVDAGTFDLMA